MIKLTNSYFFINDWSIENPNYRSYNLVTKGGYNMQGYDMQINEQIKENSEYDFLRSNDNFKKLIDKYSKTEN